MGELISVVVPVHNAEKYIRECLKSIVSQTYKDLEIIIVHDGSTDCSVNICYEFAKRDERIKIVNQVNGGNTRARKMGLAHAKGKYLSFVDSDDWILDNTIEILHDLVCTHALLHLADKIQVSKEVCYFYRIVPNSMIQKRNERILAEINRAYTGICKIDKGLGENGTLQEAFMNHLNLWTFRAAGRLFCRGYANAYIFPYEYVPHNARILLYGAGRIGQSFYRELIAVKSETTVEKIKQTLIDMGVSKEKIIWQRAQMIEDSVMTSHTKWSGLKCIC